MSGADPHRYMAPAFEVAIEGSRLGSGLTELVSDVEYESVDGIADEARVTIANPDYKMCNSPLWQAGNEMDLWFGYGTQLGYVGRVIITRPSPKFVSSGMPTIQIKGYTLDQLMMDNKPERSKSNVRNVVGDSVADAVERVAARYTFNHLDIDPTPEIGRTPPQKADASDYAYVKGLANKLGFLFWVDYEHPDHDGKGWTLHFKDPNGLRVQERKYTFEHNNGDKSTLLDFDPEMALSGSVTKLQVQSRAVDSNKELIEEFEDNAEAPDARYRNDPERQINEEQTTAGAVVKFFFGEYGVEVVADKQFKTAAEMKVWAQQWWQRKRENFIVGRGTVIGLDDLRARQTHRLVMPETSLVGDYYFQRVRHVFSSNGYLADFNARKLFTE
jgi:phage protein D